MTGLRRIAFLARAAKRWSRLAYPPKDNRAHDVVHAFMVTGDPFSKSVDKNQIMTLRFAIIGIESAPAFSYLTAPEDIIDQFKKQINTIVNTEHDIKALYQFIVFLFFVDEKLFNISALPRLIKIEQILGWW